MAHSIDAHGQEKLAKATQKHPHLWRHPQITPNPKGKIYFFQSELEDFLNPLKV